MGLFYLLLFIAGLWWTFALPWWMLAPAEARVRARQPSKQFLLSDLIWLIVLMQMGLGLATAVIDNEYKIRFQVLACFSAVALWWCTLRVLSAARVNSAGRRGVMVVFVVPLALTIVLGVLPSLFGTFACLRSLVERERPYPAEIVGLVLFVLFHPLAMLGRRLTRWAMGPAATTGAEDGSITELS